MFEELFVYPKVLARHRAGPLADAREQFLAHCAGYGAARHTLLCIAWSRNAWMLTRAKPSRWRMSKRLPTAGHAISEDVDERVADDGRGYDSFRSRRRGCGFWGAWKSSPPNPTRSPDRSMILSLICAMNADYPQAPFMQGAGTLSAFFGQASRTSARSRNSRPKTLMDFSP